MYRPVKGATAGVGELIYEPWTRENIRGWQAAEGFDYN
jgi:hypothetical protein